MNNDELVKILEKAGFDCSDTFLYAPNLNVKKDNVDYVIQPKKGGIWILRGTVGFTTERLGRIEKFENINKENVEKILKEGNKDNWVRI